MRNVFTTFCATSLIWSCALLYGFSIGKFTATPADFITASEVAEPVKLTKK